MAVLSDSSLVILLIIAYRSFATASPSVIIIGAGSAGISAASRLLENGFENVTILEAEGRIGGRIHSVFFGDVVVDLGAQWCPEDDQNVVYKMVKDYDLIESVDDSVNYLYSSKQNIDENLGRELFALCKKIYAETPVQEISTGDYIINKYNQSIMEIFGDNKEKLDFAWEILNAFKGQVLIMEGAFSWFDIVARSKENEHGAIGWKGNGYKTILDVLMKAYPDRNQQLPVIDKTILNKEVTDIMWGGTRVTVKCLDDSIYIADHVISTVSLGVLKDRSDSLFQPPLPQEKLNAIEELGIAAVMKVAFHFPKKWWLNSNFAWVHLCWLDNDRSKLLQAFPHGPNDNGHSWLEDLVQLFPSEKNSSVLVAWYTGKFVPQIEMLSDSTLVDGLMFTLNKFLGHQINVTRPDAVLRFNWYSNPHFRGVYSFETLESRQRDVPAQLALSNPVTSQDGKIRLLFAGEATNPVHYGSVHGAIETGYREADRIIHYYQNR